MSRKLSVTLLALFLGCMLISSCAEGEPEVTGEEKEITTLILTFRNTDTGETALFELFDNDADGPQSPIYLNDTLRVDASYELTIQVLNEIVSPARDVTQDILAAAEEHQFFFDPGNGLDLEFVYDDTDLNNNPIGIKALFFAGVASQGSFTVTLKQKVNKEADDVSDGDISNAGGITDIQADFNVVIN